jgi:hypothetical protein
VRKRYYLLLMLLALAMPAYGQSNYAVVTGTVTDAQQLPVAGATIELTGASTGAVRRVTSSPQGLFEAPALLPDDYELQVSAQTGETNPLYWRPGQRSAVVLVARGPMLTFFFWTARLTPSRPSTPKTRVHRQIR